MTFQCDREIILKNNDINICLKNYVSFPNFTYKMIEDEFVMCDTLNLLNIANHKNFII